MNKECLINGLKFRSLFCFSFHVLVPKLLYTLVQWPLSVSLPVYSCVSWSLRSERAINCRGTQGLTLSPSGWRVGLTGTWWRVSTHHRWHWPTYHAGYAGTLVHYAVFLWFQFEPKYPLNPIQMAFVLQTRVSWPSVILCPMDHQCLKIPELKKNFLINATQRIKEIFHAIH